VTRPPKPFLGDRRTDLSKSLRDLADELDRTDQDSTQRGLAAAIDDCYSATASGAGGGGSGGGDVTLTAVEAKASRRDPAAGPAAVLLLRLRRIERDAEEALLGLKGWRKDRATGLCPEGHMMRAGEKRCQWKDPVTGRQCGTRRETILYCENPYHLNKEGGPVRLLPGERRWEVTALDLGGKKLMECNRCRVSRGRTGRSWGSATRLNVSALGVYHSEEEPWGGAAGEPSDNQVTAV